MFSNNLLAGVSGQGGAYSIENSLRFNDNDSAYLSWTPSSAGNRKTWTFSAWVKLGNSGATRTLFAARLATSNSDSLQVYLTSNDQINVGGVSYGITATPVLRDPSGWYHIVLSYDTTQATDTNRAKIYINGIQASVTGTYPSINLDTPINNTQAHNLGRRPTENDRYFDGYMAEVNFIDGQALTADDFGEINEDTGEWSPKAYSGTYGTNGFYLPFNGNANDSSGNGNNWTENNLASTDYMIDTPTNNFATLNPLAVSSATFSQGNLNAVMSASAPAKITSTFAVSSGKYFMEYEHKGNFNWPVGISADAIQRDYLGISDGNTSISFWCSSAGTQVFINGALQSFSGGATTWSSGDIVGVALDADNQEVSLYKNGTLVGSAVSYSSYNWNQAFFAAGNYISGNVYEANFGQDSSFAGNKTRQGNTDANGIGDFYYTPPAGYLALCTDNLPAPAIEQPETQFNVVTYTGDGTASNPITGVGFQPDFVWIKRRDAVQSHILSDSVRGAGVGLASESTSAEFSIPSEFLSFDSDGFTVGYSSTITNNSGSSYVAWCWKAGGTAVSNTDGTITSQVSANVDAGFSIVSWTASGILGQTVGHGLNAAPEILIHRNRSATSDWFVHTSVIDGSFDYLILNSTAASDNVPWGSIPTSSVFNGFSYTSGNDIITYAFHSVEGFSKIGTYVGNGSADGPFVYTGFKPAFVLIKCTVTNANGHWIMKDNLRAADYNPASGNLYANLNYAEDTTASLNVDLLANGFKIKGNYAGTNASGANFIYMAFAEHPFNYATGR